MKEKQISVIIPVYNVQDYLDKCVESVVNQTYKNLEIILVDDGSTDACCEMCDRWASVDERVVVVHKQNGGLSDARNAGMQIAKGEYIGFVDSDDWIEKDFYSTLAFQLDNGADIAECATRLCDENDNTILIRGFKEDATLDKEKAVKTLLTENGIMQTVWNKLYKRECIGNILFELGKCHEDNFWTWRVFLNSKKVFVGDKPMYNYLQRKSSIMGSDYSLKRLDGLEAIYECFCELKENDAYRDIVCSKLIKNCLYNYQCSKNISDNKEKKVARKKILEYVKRSEIRANDKALNSLWYKAFVAMPRLTAEIRNILNIGF